MDQGLRRTRASRIRHAYERTKTAIGYVLLSASVVLLFFHELLGAWALALLPATVGIFLLITFETLVSVETSLRSERVSIFKTMIDAVPLMCRIVEDQGGPIDLKIICATGGSTMIYVLPPLVESCRMDEARVSIYTIDPDGPLTEHFPPRWLLEARELPDLIEKRFGTTRAEFTAYRLQALPTLHGVMINESHLFLGFTGWSHDGGALLISAGDRPHRYYSRGDPGSGQVFDAFLDWCANAPSTVAYRSPRNKQISDKTS